jgi:hypothetical protein
MDVGAEAARRWAEHCAEMRGIEPHEIAGRTAETIRAGILSRSAKGAGDMIDIAAARRLAIETRPGRRLGDVILELCDELEASRAACTRTVDWLNTRAGLSIRGVHDAAAEAAIRDLERFVHR